MAFNVGDFVKSTAKSVVDNLLGDVISAATSKLPIGTLSSANSTAQSLFNVGASFESVSAFATQKTDSIVNQGADYFYALAGKDPARTSATDLASNRRKNTQSTNEILQNSNPSTKIKAAKKTASVIVDAVV